MAISWAGRLPSLDLTRRGGVDLAEKYPRLRWQIFSGERGFDLAPLDLNRYVNVYLNDEEVRLLDGIDTPVDDGDVLTLLPASAGG
jgi:molybdopterin synthase sulfur carrier subunit